jgi:hypothetical protein
MPVHARHLAFIAERVRTGAPDEPLILARPEDLAKRTSRRRGLSPTTLQARLDRACREAGVRRFTPHGVRRSVDDLLYDGKADPSTSAKLLGHTPELAMKKYRTVRIGQKRSAMVAAGLGEVIEPASPVAVAPVTAVDLSSIPSEILFAEVSRRMSSPGDARAVGTHRGYNGG